MEEAVVSIEPVELSNGRWKRITPEDFLAMHGGNLEAAIATLQKRFPDMTANSRAKAGAERNAQGILQYLNDCISRREGIKKTGKTAAVIGVSVGTPLLAGIAAALKWRGRRAQEAKAPTPERENNAPESLPHVLGVFREIYDEQDDVGPDRLVNLISEEELSAKMMALYQHISANFSNEMPPGAEIPQKGSDVPHFLIALFHQYGYFLEFQIETYRDGLMFSAMSFPFAHRPEYSEFTVDLKPYIAVVPALEDAAEIGYEQRCIRVRQPVLIDHFGKLPDNWSSPGVGGTFTKGGHILIFAHNISRMGYQEHAVLQDEVAHAICARLIRRDILRETEGRFTLMINPNTLMAGEIYHDETATILHESQSPPEEEIAGLVELEINSPNHLNELFSISFRNVFGRERLAKALEIHVVQESDPHYDSKKFFAPIYALVIRSMYTELYPKISKMKNIRGYMVAFGLSHGWDTPLSETLPEDDVEAHNYFLALLFALDTCRRAHPRSWKTDADESIDPDRLFRYANAKALTVVIGGINTLKHAIENGISDTNSVDSDKTAQK